MQLNFFDFPFSEGMDYWVDYVIVLTKQLAIMPRIFAIAISSDGPGLGIIPKPARLRHFLGGPSPPEARSSKPNMLFRAKIGQFSAEFGKNYGTFCYKKSFQFFWLEIGQKSADSWPISGRIWGLVES